MDRDTITQKLDEIQKQLNERANLLMQSDPVFQNLVGQRKVLNEMLAGAEEVEEPKPSKDKVSKG